MSEHEGPDLFDMPLQAEMRAALTVADAPLAPPMTLRAHLVELIEDRIGDARERVLARPSDAPLLVDRVQLSDALACEAQYVAAGADPFEYDTRRARGQIAFSVIRRWYFRSAAEDRQDPEMTDLVRAVVDEQTTESGKLGAFLFGLSDVGRAELVAEVENIVSSFVECWPEDFRPAPIRNHWLLKVRLLDGRLEYRYRVSFRFGQPRRERGELRCGAVLLDIRSGRQFDEDERANRMHAALLETLSVGVPPARAVTWYAEGQQLATTEIDEAALEAAARRAGDAVRRIAELNEGRTPERRAGWRCDYC